MDRHEILSTLESYDPGFDAQQVNKAMDFAITYHGKQVRESGEPYYYHVFEVAKIIIGMHLDSKSVITALLHDTVEDTELTLKDIEKHFGIGVSKLVDGVTKLSKIEFMPDNLRQAENFRKLLLAMSNDIRVLLIKLADRLHNMRTIDFVKSETKRKRIALETMEIYAPLAERIGVQQIKVELQDICFRVLQPDVRESILNCLNVISSNEDHFIDKIVTAIAKDLKTVGINAKVYGRHKTPYSIWIKMQQKNVGLEQLSDIIAFRVIVDAVEDCYKVLGLIHTKYKMVPESFQDFISTPKNNRYQSLHTLIIGPFQQRVEVQIRTKAMHDVAELGVAAHWMYKQRHNDSIDGKQYRWINELLSILNQASDPEDFLKDTKLAMYYNQVFCFTPQGSLIALPKGATVVDFAYAVHSSIGNHCISAKINNRTVPVSTILKNGDQVEIVTDPKQTPCPSWEKFVTTGKANSEIKRFIRSRKKGQYIKLGKSIIEKALKAANINHEVLDNALIFFKKKSYAELYHAVGEGRLTREEIIKVIKPKTHSIASTLSIFKRKKKPQQLSDDSDNNYAIPIKGLISGIAVHFAGCCYPLPGDKIVGVIHAGSGVTTHEADCKMLENFASMPEKIIDLTWDINSSTLPFIASLKIGMLNEPGSLAVLSNEIAKHLGNITNLQITNRNVEYFEILLDVRVYTIGHIDDIIQALEQYSVILHVDKLK